MSSLPAQPQELIRISSESLNEDSDNGAITTDKINERNNSIGTECQSLRNRVTPTLGDEMCFPIKSRNDKITVVCL